MAVEAVDAVVVVAGVDAAECDGGGRVEGAGGAEPRPERAALPLQFAALGVDRVHVAAVVADEERPVAVGGADLIAPPSGVDQRTLPFPVASANSSPFSQPK